MRIQFSIFTVALIGGISLLTLSATTKNQTAPGQQVHAESTETAETTEVEVLAKRMRAGLQSVTPTDTYERSIEHVRYNTCLPCHGTQAEGDRAIYAPPLAGQKRWYLERQLEHFRLAIRGGHPNDVHGAVMHPIARALQNAESQKAVLDRIAEFPISDPAPTLMPAGDASRGQVIYRQLCTQCHGEDGAGIEEEGVPRLNILPDWYLVRQLQNFQAGFRGEHSEDTDGQRMRPLSLAVMQRHEMRDVAAYILTLPREEPEVK